MLYTLSIGGDERPFDDGDASDLPQLIADVAHARVDFLILTNDDTGEYVQCAEAYTRLVVERHERVGDRWRQYRLCRRGGSRERLPPRVEGFEGYEQREVLDPREVAIIFADFLAGCSPSADFELMDTTDEYEEEATSAAETSSGGFFARMKKKLLGD
jgi:hypothetical protein